MFLLRHFCLPLCFSFCLIFCLTGTAKALPDVEAHVFIYHRFGDNRYPSTNIDLGEFEAQLRYLQQHHYNVVPFSEIVRRLQMHEPMPPKTVALTVDDAYTSFLTGAMPLLRRYKYPVTIFVSSDSVGRASYLKWGELRQLVAEGVEIGNHSASHDYLLERRANESGRQWRQRISDDIQRCQTELEHELGTKITLFAYPFGEYSLELQQMVQNFGFTVAAGQQSGVIGEYSDLYALPRFPMGGSFGTLSEMKKKLAMHPLPIKLAAGTNAMVNSAKPPLLQFEIMKDDIDIRKLRCFVDGKPSGMLIPDPQHPGRFSISQTSPLTSRRTKYTLTAPGRNPGEWYWFTQLWVLPVHR